jgi:hypothetical protein
MIDCRILVIRLIYRTFFEQCVHGQNKVSDCKILISKHNCPKCCGWIQISFIDESPNQILTNQQIDYLILPPTEGSESQQSNLCLPNRSP